MAFITSIGELLLLLTARKGGVPIKMVVNAALHVSTYFSCTIWWRKKHSLLPSADCVSVICWVHDINDLQTRTCMNRRTKAKPPHSNFPRLSFCPPLLSSTISSTSRGPRRTTTSQCNMQKCRCYQHTETRSRRSSLPLPQTASSSCTNSPAGRVRSW